ncbi:hypothetical protein RIF29_41947 [Crotalaria pallida]|uniref:TIR domain-containing protein n=1 Tax=Crotalaria pallida TaxID=3830 RepID=A0AAN9E6N2_CROPI
MDCKSIIQCNSSSSSSSSSQMICCKKYDVFVSFRGEDTRNNFTDHLFAAFKRKGIVAFRDDTTLEKGKSISVELMQAIQASHVFIVVFSKNYATSTWCLEELAHIVDCIKVTGQIALPVFYDVNPSEVRKQSGDYYGKALEELEKRFKDDLEMVQRWRKALVHVAGLSGFDLHNKPQHAEIEKIIQRVRSILGFKFSSLSNDLVGMHTRVEELQKLLVLDSDDDVRVVGICGMGGIGKTTLAKELYERISHQYDACCFIDDVSEIYANIGPIGAQKELLCQTLNEENQEIRNLSKATVLIRNRLRQIRSLIVLDNVDQTEQLEKLAISREYLCAGSRVIIISRDEHILREYGVDEVCKVQPLERYNALQLFCKKAFKCDIVMREYEELTNEALNYAQGLPLAIKILGSFLYGRDMSEWKSALARLKDNPKKEILDVLQISFDGLEELEKEIFLDIACFLNHYQEVCVKRILDACGYNPDIGLRVLYDKSLIEYTHESIVMHHMLAELGMKVVREKAPNEPGKWSRLWRFKDFLNVMLENRANKNLEAITSDEFDEGCNRTILRAETFSKMSRLRLLKLRGVEFSGSLKCLSNELRYLHWENYPFIYIPSSFEPDKLVELIMPFCSIKQLWKGPKTLHFLRVIDLRQSKYLIKTPDFTGMPNLEKLNLEGCTKLVKIHSSIGLSRKLVLLNLENCTSLKNLPESIFSLSSLEILNLYGCSKLFNNQLLQKGHRSEHLTKLGISEATIQCQSTSSVHKKLMLPFHFFNSRRNKDSGGFLLLPSLPSFPCLRDLDLGFCGILKIPDAIGCFHHLERLNLEGNNFVTLPSSIKELHRLRNLNLQFCKELKYLFEDSSSNLLPVRREFVYGNYRRLALSIFNCPKSVEMESWSSMAISWMLQVIKVHHESSIRCPHFPVVVPGNQIPRWFINQSVGDSLWIDPFSFLHDSSWVGGVFCIRFVAHEQHYPSKLSCQKGPFKIRCRFDGAIKAVVPISIVVMRDLVTFELDHLYLQYFRKYPYFGSKSATVSLHVDSCLLPLAECGNFELGVDFEVKDCGFRPIFKQDLEWEGLNTILTNNDSWIVPYSTQKKPLI